MSTLWKSWMQRYRRTFIPTQAVILGICAVLDFRVKMPATGVLVYFVVMEIFSFLGVMWTQRLVNRFDRL
jgi:hypothetical protein